jgi:hypothetical protein
MGKITNITTEWVVGQATNNGMSATRYSQRIKIAK